MGTVTDRRAPWDETAAALAERVRELESEVARLREPCGACGEPEGPRYFCATCKRPLAGPDAACPACHPGPRPFAVGHGWYVDARRLSLASDAPAVPRTGEDVAALMREAWPGPEWAALRPDDGIGAYCVTGPLVWLLRYGRESQTYTGTARYSGLVLYDSLRSGVPGPAIADLRAWAARLLADLRALAPEDGPPCTGCGASVAKSARRPEIGMPVCPDCHTAWTSAGKPEPVGWWIRAARRYVTGYSPAADSPAPSSRTAADVARDALTYLRSATDALAPHADVGGFRRGAHRLSAELAALATAPAPPADPLDGLPAEVARMAESVCRNVRARGRFAAEFCRLDTITDWRADPIGCDAGWWLVAVCEEDEIDRILRVAPDGAITREGA